jgi:PadR family transcriptional regulator PadR
MVLSVLAQGPQHGYALLRQTKKLSEGRVVLQPGTLYSSLDRLKEEGLVSIVREEVVDSRLRRYYELTDAGAEELATEVRRLEANVQLAKAGLRLRPAGDMA